MPRHLGQKAPWDPVHIWKSSSAWRRATLAGIIKDERPWHGHMAKRPFDRYKMRLQQERIHGPLLLLDLAGEGCQMLLGHHQGLHNPDSFGECISGRATMCREQILADRLPFPLGRSRYFRAFSRCHIQGVPAASQIINRFAGAGHGQGIQFRESFTPAVRGVLLKDGRSKPHKHVFPPHQPASKLH